MSIKHVCFIFGVTPTVCSRITDTMLKRVVRLLQDHPLARVQFPDNNKMQEFARMVQLHEPSANDIIGFMDGVSLTSKCTDKRIDQNAFYCGYDCDTMINNVFAYLS